MPCLQAQNKGETTVSLEQIVLGLAADNVEDRKAAYQEILKNPKAYQKLLKLAAKDEDPELSSKAQDLLFYADLGIDASIRPELAHAVVLLRSLDKKNAAKAVKGMFIEGTTGKKDFSLSEYFMLQRLEKKYPVDSSKLRDCFIAAQASHAFTLVLQKGEDPFTYMNKVFCPPTTLSFTFTELLGRLYGINGTAFIPDGNHALTTAWGELIMSPLFYEGKIRAQSTSYEIDWALDLALHRTDRLNCIFKENGSSYTSTGALEEVRLAYDWMQLNQEGKKPSRAEFGDKIIAACMDGKGERRYLVSSLATIGKIPDKEDAVKWSMSPEDRELYNQEIGIISTETARKLAEESLARLKAKSSKAEMEICFFCGVMYQLEQKGEYEQVKQASADFISCVDKEGISSFLTSGSETALILQCAIATQYPDLIPIMEEICAGKDLLPRELIHRLFDDLTIGEQHHLLLLTQRHIVPWEAFLDEKLAALLSQNKAGDPQFINDLYFLSELLYFIGWEKQGLKVALAIKESPPPPCYTVTLYHTVRILIEQGKLTEAEAFFNRYSPEAYSKSSSYWLAKAEIAKAKGDQKNAGTYLKYAQQINVLDRVIDPFVEPAFMVNLVRGSYLKEAAQSLSCKSPYLPSLLKIAQRYMQQGDWYKARFFFEYYLHAVIPFSKMSDVMTIYSARMQSELAQALYYMGRGEPEKAPVHLELCFELLQVLPECAEEVFKPLCGSLSLASIEQKQELLDKAIKSFQGLSKQMPKHYFYPRALQFMQELKVQPAAVQKLKHDTTPHIAPQDDAFRPWVVNGAKLEAAIRSCKKKSLDLKMKDTGVIKRVWFSSLSQEDINYAKAWDRYRKIKDDYAASCAQDKTKLTWLEDASLAQQLARVLNKGLIVVALPPKDSPDYKVFFPFLKSEKLRNLVGDKVVCVLLQPEADGTWSPRNEAFIKGYGGGNGAGRGNTLMFSLVRGNNRSTIFPSSGASEESILKFFEKDFSPKK